MKSKAIHRGAILFFSLVFAAMLWPIHPLFSRVHPMVIGLPFSLLYLIVLIGISFLALLGLYLWETRQERAEY